MTIHKNLRSAFLKGAAWATAMRWSVKLIGLGSTLIVARLLSPADYGVVAMAMLLIGFVEIWLALGLDVALIQNQNVTREHYDTAWTIRLLQSLAVAATLALVAPLAAAYFREPRVAMVTWVICGGVIVAGFANIGPVTFRKEMRFDKEFGLNVSARLASAIVAVVAAIWLRSYWALVIGVCASYVLGTLMSYVWHPYRPRFSLRRFHELWGYSKWMLGYNIAVFADSRADEMVVGRIGDAQQFGLYNVASELGQMPSSELGAAVNRAALPALALIQDEAGRIRAAALNLLGATSTITLPAGIGLAFVSTDLVRLILGEQWLGAAPVLAVIAIYAAVRTTSSSPYNLFLAIGRPAIPAVLTWVSLAVFLLVALSLGVQHGLLGVAYSRLTGGVAVTVLAWILAIRHTSITPLDILRYLWRPILASIAMWAVLELVSPLSATTLINLILTVLLGAGVYVAALGLAWVVASKPDGIERIVMGRLQAMLGKLHA